MARYRLVRLDSAVDGLVLVGPVLLSPYHHSYAAICFLRQ
jgi:hypothetical protein